MASNRNVNEVAARLEQAIETALNPSSLQQQRVEAYEFIEQFKSGSPLCIPVGLVLFDYRHSPAIRHTGLQLLEHTVKFKWNSLSLDDQENLKETSLRLVAQGGGPTPDEPRHVKEALSRLIVEIAKREWPQNWASLLPDLNKICSFGDVQTELVLMVLLRLAEDAISMDMHLQQNRKKQITNALHSNMGGLFSFFVKSLQRSTWRFKDLTNKIQSGNISFQHQAAVHRRLAEQTLLTLTGFLDWAKLEVILSQDCIILQMLCLLLEEDSLKIPSCECLLIIVSRKGKLEQRMPLLKLFSEDAMLVMLSAAQKSVTSEFDEKQYLFLKRLCQVLVALGEAQLFNLWNAERPKGKPPNFRQYLEAVVAFSKHESLILPLLTSALWLTFLRNPVIRQDETFQAIFPSLLEIMQTKLFKVGDPEKGDSPGSIFNREDFSSAKSFISIFAQLRGGAMDIIRQITSLQPTETFKRGADWLSQKIAQLPVLDATTTSQEMEALKQEWIGLNCYLEAVVSRFFKLENLQEIIEKEVNFKGNSVRIVELARNCIQSLLASDSENPNVLTGIVDATQTLYPFLTFNQDLMMEILKKMFKVILFNTTGDCKAPWSQEVLHTRRRACAAVFKICRDFGERLVPLFEALKKHIQSFFVKDLIAVKDRCTLTEALIHVSNQLKDGVKQKAFLDELLTPIREIWLTESIRGAISSPEGLASFIGLDNDQTVQGQDEKSRDGRFQIMLSMSTILGIVRICAIQHSTENAASEGLSIGLMPNGTPYVHNPSASLVLPLLGNVFLLAKSLNSLYSPSVIAGMTPGYASALEMHDLDKSAINALFQPQDKDKSEEVAAQNPLKSSQSFLYQLTECCYHTLGYACSCLSHDFYSFPGIAKLIVESVVNSLQHVPNYRLRFIVRNFMKMLIVFCPACDYQNVLIPVLSPFLAFMLQHLEEQWLKVRKHQAESAADDDKGKDDIESKEIIEDQLVFIITRDYVDIFTLACTVGCKEVAASSGMEVTQEYESKEEGEYGTAKKEGQDQFNMKLGSLGFLLLQTESANMQLLCTIFCCMTWPDSIACHRATRLAMPFIREILSICNEAGTRINDTIFDQLFSQVLKGLQVHGQCSTQLYLMYVGQDMYELLRPQYPSLRQVLLQMTNCLPEDLQTFESLCFGGKEVAEKRKKEQFKKLVTGIVGKHIGEMFKNEIKIKDLPPIQIKTKEKPVNDSHLAGLQELFDPNRTSEVE